MDRYQRVERPKPETSINQNEIRITTQGLIRNYVSYAASLLQEKKTSEIVLKAMGQAISKAVAIAEIIKRRLPGLHQNTTISSTSITDVWEPIEEGLLPLETTRHVSMITITLSTKELDKTSTGYQPPLLTDQLKPQAGVEGALRGGRARGRGRGRGRGWGRADNGGYYDDDGNYYDGGYYGGWYFGWGRGRGRGRGRGGRWRGRGRRGRGRGPAAMKVEPEF